MSEQKFASFDPSDMKEGTNLFDDVNLETVGGRFTKEAPDNYQAEGNPIFAYFDFFMYEAPEDKNRAADSPDPRRVNQSYSLGASSGDHWTISEDGLKLIPVDPENVVPLRKDSKFGTYMDAAKKEGIPASILQAGDLSKFFGLKAHHRRVADKERSFGDQKKDQKKSKFPPSTLVITKVVSLPGQAAKSGNAPTTANASPAAQTTTASASSVPEGDVDTKAGIYLAQVVKAKGGTLQRGNILLMVRQAAMKDPQGQDIAKRATEETFLQKINEQGGVLDAEGNVVALQYDAAAKPQVVRIAA